MSKKDKLVTVPFKSKHPAWEIVKMLEENNELKAIDIQVTKGFWDRTIKHWKEHGFDKRNS